LNVPTASGAITVLTAEGVPIGHGWGEVRVRRDPGTGGPGVVGELREMTWSTDRAPLDPRQSYRVGFHGGPSFVGVFDGPFPDANRRRATFRPSGPKAVPTGPSRLVWPTTFPARRP
jgi:hypothetical protein